MSDIVNLYSRPRLSPCTRDDIISFLESEWEGKTVNEAFFGHLAKVEWIDRQFKDATAPLALIYVTLPTTEEHREWCDLCREHKFLADKLGQCVAKFVGTIV